MRYSNTPAPTPLTLEKFPSSNRRTAVVIFAAAVAVVACSRDPNVLKERYFTSGNSYVESGKYREAILEYRRAVRADGTFGEARLRLAEAYEHVGDTQNAFREYVRAADLLPDRMDVQIKAAQFLLVAGRFADARARAEALAASGDRGGVGEGTDAWWAGYRAEVPRVAVPDPALQRAWDYGVFNQAGLTPPDGVAATLQGPWMAETGLPPWSNDYHFNINLQMIYWPCLPTNRPGHLRPTAKKPFLPRGISPFRGAVGEAAARLLCYNARFPSRQFPAIPRPRSRVGRTRTAALPVFARNVQ